MTAKSLLAVLAALVLAPAIAAAAGGLPKQDIVEFQLENGLDVVYLGVHRSPIVSVQVWYHVGSKDEPAGQHGAAHMFEHMMFKGTRFVRPDQQTRMINGLGGKVDAFTREDMTAFVDTVPKTALDFVVRLEADRMRNLLIRKDMVDVQREIVKEEKHARVDNSPVARALERFRRIAYAVHPYGYVSAGTVEDLDRLKPSDLQKFYDLYYRPNNAVLVVVGDVSEAEVRAAAQRWFAPLEKGPTLPRPAATAVEPEQKQTRKETVGSSQLGLVVAGWHIPPAKSDDIFALQILANILSGSDTGRLSARLVRKDQSGVYASGQMLLLEDPGMFVVYGVYLRPQAGPRVEEALEDEIERLGREPVGESELIRAKAQLGAGFIFGLETVEALGTQIGASRIITGDAKGWVGDYDRYQAVTSADLKRVAKQYLTPANMTVVVVPPAVGGGK